MQCADDEDVDGPKIAEMPIFKDIEIISWVEQTITETFAHL